MPLIIDEEHLSRSGRLDSDVARSRSLGRIVSGMKVSTEGSDLAGLNRLTRDISALFAKSQVKQPGVAESALYKISQQPQLVW